MADLQSARKRQRSGSDFAIGLLPWLPCRVHLGDSSSDMGIKKWTLPRHVLRLPIYVRSW